MEQRCLEQLNKVLAHWTTADVRIVPGVMCQIRCGDDENDSSIEYQFNWFIDCQETFVHNHRHSFCTLCLEGGYTEKIWEIVDDNTGDITYQFYRGSGNVLGVPEVKHGRLCHVKSRSHFPGNQMHVDITQFHSIATTEGITDRVFTFLAKQKYIPIPDMYILSSSSTINAPKDEIRLATEVERQNMYDKLQQIRRTKFND